MRKAVLDEVKEVPIRSVDLIDLLEHLGVILYFVKVVDIWQSDQFLKSILIVT